MDRFGVDVLLLDAIGRMTGGLVNVAIIFTSDYYLFLAEAAVFGVCMGQYSCTIHFWGGRSFWVWRGIDVWVSGINF